MVLEAGGHPDACLLAALLADGRAPSPDGRTTESDLLSLLPVARALPHVARAAGMIRRELTDTPRTARSDSAHVAALDDEVLCRAVLAGFPDRVAQRRTPNGDALLLATGTGARLSPSSGVRNAEYLVALDVRGVRAGKRSCTWPVASSVDG